MSTLPPPSNPPPPQPYRSREDWAPTAPTSPPAAPGSDLAPTITAPAAAPQAQQAPAAEPAAAPAAPRRRALIVAGVVVATVVLVVLAVLTRPTSGGRGEKATASGLLTPVHTFTPQSLHQAVLSTPFPANLLPSGFSFDGQKSPGGKLYPAQGFSTPEKTQQHHSVGTAAVALSSSDTNDAFQITFLSFADPASAEAYMQEARNATGVQAPPGQPVCGAVGTGTVAGCSVAVENVVVEGRAKSTSDQPIANTDAAVATTNSLAQAGITYLHQIKGG